MIQQQASSLWTFWSYYSGSGRERGPQNEEDYHRNLVRVLSFGSMAELAYLLQRSHLASLDSFFTDVQGRKVLK